ncbi:MAG: malonyl-ACP O-methyltransferase BioC [Candidatus Endonucleobacter bathymodioli]|uniref:Malonyl-[acyl-carrier protein] O-methyltransferase n=1 Tax=Candidatus Endonucleibacter bathymodioli TaxID=539814 RepID=A0AA90SY81_9GAMM|nr:malonyl-ACP O-methyltransferase BioC [Candidatus Endonucleobacter bathymodioli]
MNYAKKSNGKKPLVTSLDRSFKKRVASHFSRAATSYDDVARLQKRVAASTMMLLPSSQIPLTILDLGSGTGCQTNVLAKQYPGSLVVGTDLSSGMVQYAKSKYSEVCNSVWSIGDIENIPFQSSSFNLVYSSLAIQWCDLQTVIQQVKRILKPKGTFIFSTLAEGSISELRAAWQLVDEGIHINYFPSFFEQKKLLENGSVQLKALRCQHETLFYSDTLTLLRELKALGVNAIRLPRKGLMSRKKLKALCTAYETFREDAGLPLSYKVIYGKIGLL